MLSVPRIHVDFETRSTVNLLKLGADVYARHWSTSPLMLSIVARHLNVAYVEDFMLGTPGYQQCCYPFCEPGDLMFRFIKPVCPPILLQAINEGWIFVAHNARFEQTIWYHICHKVWGWPMPTKWSCTAARSRYWGIRASLEGSGSDLEIVLKKNPNGKQFIDDFCKPRKWKGAQKLGIIKDLWYEPQENVQGWESGLAYCLDDSYAEEEIDSILPDLPPMEQDIYDLDFKMNIRGIPIDTQSVERAIQFAEHFTAINFARFEQITNLRPTQRDRVLEYVNQQDEIIEKGGLDNLKSKTLTRLVMDDMPPDLQDVIQIRLQTSKASPKKLYTMKLCTDDDGFARGGHLYYGAHTGRWSHKRIQTGNMMRPDVDAPQEYMFQFLEHECWNRSVLTLRHEMPEQPAWIQEAGMRFIRPLGYLGTAMRGFIKAPKGKKIVNGDYAQIEARILVWLAREMWVLDAFRQKQDTYARFAADHMYHEPYEDYFEFKGDKRVVRKSHSKKRQGAKSGQLGCGFQASAKGLREYCDNIGLIISLEEAEFIVKAYRDAHPMVVQLWGRMFHAALAATTNEGQVIELANTGITYHVHRLDAERYWLICTLPSGRHIAYYRPKVRLGTRWGRTVEILSYRTEWNGKSYREDTYGGKLTENAVQAIGRDVCALGALNAEAAGYPVIMLVHDDVVTLPDEDFGNHIHLCEQLVRLPPWITDLPVEADGGTMLRLGK